MNDFHDLSPLDFEELVRDLLQAHWSRRLESFGPGRDQGVDVRYMSGPQQIVVQAKHYARSGPAALVRAMRRECPKAITLSPSRYLLATSVSMTPALKAKIVAAMPEVPLAEVDILGREDLNNLLRLHSEVEQRHFKLWLASSAVLERIIHSGVYNRTAAELEIIRGMIPRFVQNQSVADAETLLADTGALIIAGAPGVGKTTLAQILLWRHAEQGWRIFVVDDIEEAMAVASEGERRLIFFDDFLGQVALSADHVRGLDARLPPLLSRVAAQKDLRFILTTRDYVLAQAKMLSARLDAAKGVRSYVLNVGAYTREAKARILYNHIHFSGLTETQKDAILEDGFYLAMIDHKNFNPRLIEMLTRSEYLALDERPTRELIQHVLDNPHELWDRPYRQHMSEDARTVLLAMAINGAFVGITLLKDSFVRVATALGNTLRTSEIEARFRAAYQEIEGSALSLLNSLVHFTNPGLRDYLRGVIRSDRLMPLIVPCIETANELGECFEIFRVHRGDWEGSTTVWTAALDRVRDGGRVQRLAYLELALDLCDEFRDQGLIDRMLTALMGIEQEGVDEAEVREICSLLERSAMTLLPTEVEARVRSVATEAAATMLEEKAMCLPLEDIESMDEALFTYGNDQERAATAVQSAMWTFTRSVDCDLEAITTLDDLDEFEGSLLALLEKRGFSSDTVKRDIRWRREALEENEPRHDPEEGYRGGGVTSHRNMSDAEIRSMFNGLKG
ncbi:nSTAND3 domain-containing NTPase [Novosphingobium aquimarinum]|uniref:nSTAND3 domain-containing NTPase n=1 Tax=Novosphingobium aquimarinum TaxID=2682494 RepID=UPI0012EC76A5|nr:restriction endonuclease [Novosphingobium aquimarinum]